MTRLVCLERGQARKMPVQVQYGSANDVLGHFSKALTFFSHLALLVSLPLKSVHRLELQNCKDEDSR